MLTWKLQRFTVLSLKMQLTGWMNHLISMILNALEWTRMQAGIFIWILYLMAQNWESGTQKSVWFFDSITLSECYTYFVKYKNSMVKQKQVFWSICSLLTGKPCRTKTKRVFVWQMNSLNKPWRMESRYFCSFTARVNTALLEIDHWDTDSFLQWATTYSPLIIAVSSVWFTIFTWIMMLQAYSFQCDGLFRQ